MDYRIYDTHLTLEDDFFAALHDRLNSYYERLSELEKSSGFRIPEPSILRDLVTTALRASVGRDEGRAIHFKLVYADVLDDQMCHFATPVPFESETLLKLAPAFDKHQFICVQPGPDGALEMKTGARGAYGPG